MTLLKKFVSENKIHQEKQTKPYLTAQVQHFPLDLFRHSLVSSSYNDEERLLQENSLAYMT